jgi:hypothetical protein
MSSRYKLILISESHRFLPFLIHLINKYIYISICFGTLIIYNYFGSFLEAK